MEVYVLLKSPKSFDEDDYDDDDLGALSGIADVWYLDDVLIGVYDSDVKALAKAVEKAGDDAIVERCDDGSITIGENYLIVKKTME